MNARAIALAAMLPVLAIAAIHNGRGLQADRRELAGLRTQSGRPPATHPVQHGSPAIEAEVAPTVPADAASRDYATHRIEQVLRRTVAAEHPDLARDLGISQAEADQFLDLLAHQQAAVTPVTGTTAADLVRVAGQSLDRQSRDRAEQLAMLGNRYPLWLEHQGKVDARRQVQKLQAILLSEGMALTDAQQEQLVAAIGRVTARLHEEFQAGAPSSDAGTGFAAERNRRAITAAAPLVTPGQLAGFRQMLDDQEQTLRLTQRAMDSLLGQVTPR